jgi:hypothetical protein
MTPILTAFDQKLTYHLAASEPPPLVASGHKHSCLYQDMLLSHSH